MKLHHIRYLHLWFIQKKIAIAMLAFFSTTILLTFTFMRSICCLVKACCFWRDWYCTLKLINCLSISARLSSTCKRGFFSTISHKHYMILYYLIILNVIPQRIRNFLCCSDPVHAAAPGSIVFEDPGWLPLNSNMKHEISMCKDFCWWQ